MKNLFFTITFGIATLFMQAGLLAQEPQSEFVPVTEIPASEQLPSAPLVIAAYAFVWLAFAAYVWMMWRRVGRVEQEIHTLSAQISKPHAMRREGVHQ